MDRGYKTRTIKRVIRKKLESWIESLPENLRSVAHENVIVTGGAVASMLIGEEVKDFDLYFKTKSSVEEIARHYVEAWIKRKPDANIVPEVQVSSDRVRIMIQSAGVAGEGGDDDYEYFEATPNEQAAENFLDKQEKTSNAKLDPFSPVFLSENAISLTDKVQLVVRFFGEPQDIHRNYDFDHCKCWYDLATDHLGTPQEALLSLMSRTLRYSGSLYPLCSLFRMRKFVARGWVINAGEILKMGFQVSELNMQDVNVLREQLVGVDMAYFHELLRIMEEEKEQRGSKPIDATYIAQLVDRIFNE